MNEKTLFLFTKHFPFGNQETYLFDEVPFLIKEFEKIYIVPCDENDYADSKNRLIDEQNVEIVRINSYKSHFSFPEKIMREISVWKVLLLEMLFGRDSKSHLTKIKGLLSQLRHLYFSSRVLLQFINKNGNISSKVVAYCYWLHRGVIVSNWLKKKCNRQVVVIARAHSLDLYHKSWNVFLKLKKPLFLPFESFKIKHADKIVSVSAHGYNHLLNTFPKNRSKFEVARLGVFDFEKFMSLKNIERKTKVIVTCSAITENKRIYLMPSILKGLNFDFRWIHFGSGAEADTEKLKKEIRIFQLEEKCELKGLTPHNQIIEFYKSNFVDLIINLSLAEGIPVALMEAASFGIPMVATNTIGSPEIVNDENGFLISVDFSTKELANSINKYFSNEDYVSKKRAASRNTFLQMFSAEKNYSQFTKLLASL